MLDNKSNGGERGIRTLDTGVSPYNGLANRRLQPLGHLSVLQTSSPVEAQGMLQNRPRRPHHTRRAPAPNSAAIVITHRLQRMVNRRSCVIETYPYDGLAISRRATSTPASLQQKLFRNCSRLAGEPALRFSLARCRRQPGLSKNDHEILAGIAQSASIPLA